MVAIPLLGLSSINSRPVFKMDQLIDQLVKANDIKLPEYLKRQEQDSGHQWFGGITDQYGIFHAGATAGFIKALSCSYVSESSTYFHDNALVGPMEDAAKYLMKSQYKDGTIDLPSTNFHSTPDTAFVVEPLCIVYNLLQNDGSKETSSPDE